MRFTVAPGIGGTPNRMLVYRADEYSFDVVPAPTDAFTSVVLNDLNLELNAAGRVVSVWGVCAHMQWQLARLSPPHAAFGDVVVASSAPFARGISMRLNHNNYWPVLVDLDAGWVCVRGRKSATSAVKILPGIILEITRQAELCGLWLSPLELPKVTGHGVPSR